MDINNFTDNVPSGPTGENKTKVPIDPKKGQKVATLAKETLISQESSSLSSNQSNSPLQRSITKQPENEEVGNLVKESLKFNQGTSIQSWPQNPEVIYLYQQRSQMVVTQLSEHKHNEAGDKLSTVGTESTEKVIQVCVGASEINDPIYFGEREGKLVQMETKDGALGVMDKNNNVAIFRSEEAKTEFQELFKEGKFNREDFKDLDEKQFEQFKQGSWFEHASIASDETEWENSISQIEKQAEVRKLEESTLITKQEGSETNIQSETLKETEPKSDLPPIHPEIRGSLENKSKTEELSFQESYLLAFAKQREMLSEAGKKEKELQQQEEQRKIVLEDINRQELVFFLLKYENLAQEIAKEGNKELETIVRDIIVDRIITKRQMRAESYALGLLVLKEVFDQATLEKNDIESRDEL